MNEHKTPEDFKREKAIADRGVALAWYCLFCGQRNTEKLNESKELCDNCKQPRTKIIMKEK